MKSWTYEGAGVPHLKGDPAYNRQISKWIRSTLTPAVRRATEVGANRLGFASLFDLEKIRLRHPLLVSTTDGVGTKLELARLLQRHDTIGIDLVAMCVNDLLTMGAQPLFFLDYFATGKFKPEVTREVLKGIVYGCRKAGCALVGGETAIMPGFYGDSKYDLAGFAVGVVERTRVVDGSKIRVGDRLLGLASSGFHSNGYSLLRKIFSQAELRGKVGEELLIPTRIYVKPVLTVLKKIPLRGIVNITGGGFYDNLPRVLPEGLGVTIEKDSWPRPKSFETVAERGNISRFEMFRTFNMGIGMILVLTPREVEKAGKILKQFRVASWEIGEVIRGKGVEIQ